MMKKLLLTAILLGIVSIFSSTAFSQNKKVIGEWKYQVPSAPIGYDTGTLVITEKQDTLKGKVNFSDGYGVTLRDLEFKEGNLKFGLYVDYDYITAAIKVDGKKMKGTVKTPNGDMPLTAEKIK